MAAQSTPSGGFFPPTIPPNWKEPGIFKQASDSRGHSENLNLRIPPILASIIRAIVDQVPDYERNLSHFCRDALYKHVVHVAGVMSVNGFNSRFAALTAMQQAVQRAEEMRAFSDEMARIKSVADELRVFFEKGDSEARTEAVTLFRELNDSVSKFDDFWRRRYSTAMFELFRWALSE